MSTLSTQDQSRHAVKLLELLKNNPTPATVSLVQKLVWELPGELGEDNGIIVDFGEYIGTLNDIVNNHYADDGWLADYKKRVLDNLEGFVDKHTLDEFRNLDHLKIITNRVTRTLSNELSDAE